MASNSRDLCLSLDKSYLTWPTFYQQKASLYLIDHGCVWWTASARLSARNGWNPISIQWNKRAIPTSLGFCRLPRCVYEGFGYCSHSLIDCTPVRSQYLSKLGCGGSAARFSNSLLKCSWAVVRRRWHEKRSRRAKVTELLWVIWDHMSLTSYQPPSVPHNSYLHHHHHALSLLHLLLLMVVVNRLGLLHLPWVCVLPSAMIITYHNNNCCSEPITSSWPRLGQNNPQRANTLDGLCARLPLSNQTRGVAIRV